MNDSSMLLYKTRLPVIHLAAYSVLVPYLYWLWDKQSSAFYVQYQLGINHVSSIKDQFTPWYTKKRKNVTNDTNK